MKSAGSSLSDRHFAEAILARLQAGERVALCSVLNTRGSMPRPADARMALFEDGEFAGTIGGGRIEFLGQERCRVLQQTSQSGNEDAGRSEVRWFTREDTGMMCGGDALVAVRMLDQRDCAVLESVLACGRLGGILVEDWSNSAHPSWDARIAGADEEIPSASAWNAERSIYVEPLHAEVGVNVYGAGHVSQALVPVLASLGLVVSVFDEREELLSAERFPAAERLQVCRYDSLGADELPAKHDYAIIMTHSHTSDYAVLEQMMRCVPAYVGCIGSRGKTARFKSWLAEAGFGQDRIDGVHMPIGEAIGAVTPAEIAVSIAAELIGFRAGQR